MSTTCRSCGAAIVWVTTVEGKRMPLDTKSVQGGNVEVERGIARVLAHDPARVAYVSHFATCKDAPEWRKKGARSDAV